MAGLDRDTPVPSDIKLHRLSRMLELQYPNGDRFELPCEYLRVFTPSAEAKGHGVGQEVLQVGKREVNIERIEPVGNYALKFVFSDGHDTGLYSWDLLYNLGKHHQELWQEYLKRLELAGFSRDAANPAPATGHGGGCSHHH